MKISENSLKWMMRFYPPLFFQRIWVSKVEKNFRGITVKVIRSIFTSNLGKSTFGGTIYAATDPFYALLFGQILQHKGYKVTVWLKSGQIEYLKPARTDLTFKLVVDDQMIADAESALKLEGKFVKTYPIELFDDNNELCVTALNEVYVRNLAFFNEDRPGATG